IAVMISPVIAQGDPDNRLVNGSLERPYYAQGGPTLTVPQGWNLWINSGDPAAIPHTELAQVQDGQAAWLLQQNGAAFTAAGYQTVSGLQAGATLRASAFGRVFTCDDTVNTCIIPDPPYRQSDRTAGALLLVGIDPLGGIDPLAGTIQWSDDAAPYDEWQEISVTAIAAGDTATVFLFMTQSQGLALNNVLWDNVSLVQTETPTPTPTLTPTITATLTTTPPPTLTPTSVKFTATAGPSPTPDPSSTPEPTATGAPTSTPEPTVTPTLIPTSSPLPVADLPLAAQWGTLCAGVFVDTNQNGRRDEGEADLPGTQVALQPGERVIDLAGEPVCLSLPPGTYTAQAWLPAGYGATGPDSLVITLAKGRDIHIVFGAAAGYVPTPVPGSTDDPAGISAVSPGAVAPLVAIPASVNGGGDKSTLDKLYDFSGYLVLGLAGMAAVVGLMLLVIMRRPGP
ncbi:MAG: hypothetical protein JXQ72_14930, partial [Anaerolineae bacterium]|nr:hypothetical protein [Anaerolineae bacterium]